MPNQTCRFLSNGYKFITVSDTVKYLPCCYFGGGTFNDAPVATAPDTEHQKYRNFLNSIDSYSHPGCDQCNYLNNNNLAKTWRTVSDEIVPNDAKLGDSSYLEIQVDKTCNGGCIMCGPYLSTFWMNEIGQVDWTPKQIHNDLDQILKLVDIQKSKVIHFLGGEPFLSTADETVIHLINDPSDVSLRYTTNGSIFPSDSKLELWKKFKNVRLNFSLDGINERFNYIRYPLKWDQVVYNLQKFINTMPENVTFKINHTVNIFNLYYYKEFDDWHKENFNVDRFGREIECSYNVALGELSPKTIPKKLFKVLCQKYNYNSKPIKTVLSTDIENTRVLEYIDKIDQRRKLSWRTVFPEIADCF